MTHPTYAANDEITPPRRDLSQPTTEELIDLIASYRHVLGADPTIGATLEYVAEVLRRLNVMGADQIRSDAT